MKAYEECYREAEDYGTPLPAELIAKAYGSKKLLNYSREHSHFYKWLNHCENDLTLQNPYIAITLNS